MTNIFKKLGIKRGQHHVDVRERDEYARKLESALEALSAKYKRNIVMVADSVDATLAECKKLHASIITERQHLFATHEKAFSANENYAHIARATFDKMHEKVTDTAKIRIANLSTAYQMEMAFETNNVQMTCH